MPIKNQNKPRGTRNSNKIATNTTTKEIQPLSTKRSHGNLSSPESAPISKIQATMPNTSEPLTIDAITKLLQEQTKIIQTSMQNDMVSLGNAIKSELQTQIKHLNDKIEANQTNVQKQIDELKSNVDQCTNKMSNSDDDLQRISKLNELKISGISHTNDQNLNAIFNDIAKLVNFDVSNMSNVPTLTRIFKHNKTSNSSSATPYVIVKFLANHIRNDFYSLYLNKIAAKQPIMSENINLPKGTRIIIGENLTAMNHGIFV